MANKARNTPQSSAPDAGKTTANLQVAYEKNKKRIVGVLTGVLVAVAGVLLYFNFYKAPRETKASGFIYQAQRYFDQDSLDKALNGDGQHAGFLKVIRDYDGTRAANLSNYYAGVAYLKQGDFRNAVKHLEKFNGKGTTLEKVALGTLGDAYMESGDVKKGIEAYRRATGRKDMQLTPLYLMRLGIACNMDNKPEDAKKAFLRIRDEFPASTQAREVEKHLAMLGVTE